jgi:large subunit ribosomal protein L24
MKFKKGDKVQIMRGKDRGKAGKILQFLPKKNQVVVEGMNLHFRHLRPRKSGEKGQRVEFPAPIHASNVMMLDAKTNKPTRNIKTQKSQKTKDKK